MLAFSGQAKQAEEEMTWINKMFESKFQANKIDAWFLGESIHLTDADSFPEKLVSFPVFPSMYYAQ